MAERSELRLRVFVALTAVIGALTIAAAVLIDGISLRSWHYVLLIFAADSALNAWPLSLRWKGEGHDMAMDEVVFVAAAFLVGPAEALIGIAGATFVADLRRRLGALKLAFNFGERSATCALGLAAASLVAGSTSPFDLNARGLAAAGIGAATFFGTSVLWVRSVVSIASGVPYRRVARDSQTLAALVAGTGISLGMLVAGAMSVQPFLGLVAVFPVAVADRVLRQYASGQRDRHRLDGLLKTALDTHASMGLRDVEIALLRNTQDLLNAAGASLDPVPGPEGALSARLIHEGRPMWLTVPPRRPAYDAQDQGLLDGLAAIGATALENARLMAEAHREAFHDALTGLANRTLFEDRCEHALAQAHRNGGDLALLFIDLDRFKRVNDNLGHAAGDELLRQAGARISSVVRSVDTACRMGGDEFTVLLSGNSRSEAEAVIDRLRATMAEPFTIEEQEVFVRANVGMAIYPDDGLDYRALLQSADASMYLSKRRERDLPAPEQRPTSSLSLESQLHRAIERGELRVLYQPQLRISSRDVVGFEALVRWQHPVLGTVSPGVFLPLAEESGVISDIDAWVLKTATWQLNQWAEAGFALPTVAVNLSAAMARSDRLESLVLDTLQEAHLDPPLLELEVTERVASVDDAETVATLSRLRDRGVRIAVDDFGTGYSSLSRLRDFPVDNVKIDRSFVSGIHSSTDASPIVDGAISLAHAVGAIVTAEGIETPEQFRYLEAKGCEIGQGFLLGRPESAEHAERFLVRRTPLIVIA